MKQVPKKNYIYVVILIVVTFILVLSLSNIYTSKNKLTTDFYQYSNIITSNEFENFIFENPDSIIYISDKYDLKYAKFENDLKNIIDALNIKNNFVYMDKEYLSSEFINKLKTKYNVSLQYDKKPIVLFIVNKEIIKVIDVDVNTDATTFIDYEVFK